MSLFPRRRSFSASLPSSPGVYIFKDKSRKPIYVGKSKLLKARVKSYFTAGTYLSLKTKLLSNQINQVDLIKTESELEAILLEAKLIRILMPKYNVRLRDDKSPLYVFITETEYPKVLLVRKTEIINKDKLDVFGPFLSAKQALSILALARKMFPFCMKKTDNGRACFYTHLGLCPGACVQKISSLEYRRTIKKLRLFLSGKITAVKKDVAAEMKLHAKRDEFELAAKCRDTLFALNSLTAFSDQSDDVMTKYRPLDWTDCLRKTLAKQLIILGSNPLRVEGFDISHLGGKLATASMVVFTNGEADKSQYRQFRIKHSPIADDPRMIAEVIGRRLLHSEWPKPDLILIDGGSPQLTAVQKEFACITKLPSNIPFIGLAKPDKSTNQNLDTIVIPQKNGFKHLKLSAADPTLLLLMKIRDESHRFGRRYHHWLRWKNILM